MAADHSAATHALPALPAPLCPYHLRVCPQFGSIAGVGSSPLANIGRMDGGSGAVSSRFAQQAWNGRTMNSPLELY